jgi:hypothetical protein
MENSSVVWNEYMVPGRVVVIVRDEYTARVLSEYLGDRENESGSTNPNSGVQQRLLLFVTQQCDKIRKQLKNGRISGSKSSVLAESKSEPLSKSASSLDESQINRLSVEQKMLLALEERLYLTLDDAENPSGTSETISESKATNKTDIFSKAKRARSSMESATFDGMREISDEVQVGIMEFPHLNSCDSLGSATKKASVGATRDGRSSKSSTNISHDRFHVVILTHQEIRNKVHAIIELCPAAVVLLDPDLLAIRLLETHAVTTKNVIKVSQDFDACESIPIY